VIDAARAGLGCSELTSCSQGTRPYRRSWLQPTTADRSWAAGPAVRKGFCLPHATDYGLPPAAYSRPFGSMPADL
jgi:hypothetical protein